MMRPTPYRRLAAVLGSVALVVAMSACASDVSPSPPRPPSPPSGAVAEPCSLQDSLELLAFEADYDSIASPAALAEKSLLVVTGTIERVQEGRLEIVPKNDEEPGVSTIVLVLRDVTAVQGSLEGGNDGFVYIELENPGQLEPQAYVGGLCTGSTVVAYLGVAPLGEPEKGIDRAIAEPLAGRPDGQALYRTIGHQALILQHPGEPVVWPLTGEQRDGTIEDTLPDGTLIAP
ncbi:MAG: hypothetical protein ACOH19_16900 [Rhodoglobus sp.]